MKAKIKSLAYAASAMALSLPMIVSAQLREPSGTNLPAGTITNIVTKVMNWILGLVGVVGVIGFAIAGVLYLTAAGDEERIKTAKTAMLYSIIGVIVALLGLVILKAANTMLGGTDSTF